MTAAHRTILLVEDSDDDYFATQRAFTKAGLANPLVRCRDGEEALDYLFRRTGQDAANAPRPGLVLLDLNLPKIDGRQVLRLIKEDAELRKIPVIVLTTSNDAVDVERCYADGANSYVQKPVDIGGFVLAISRLKDYWFEVSILPDEAGGRSWPGGEEWRFS